MDTKGRGRGRGRKAEMRKPDQAAVEKIKQEQEQAAADKSGSQSPTLSEQMADPPGLAAVERVKQQADKSGSQLSEKIADPPNEGTADAAKIKEPDVAAELAQSPTTAQAQQTTDSPADTAMTTTGEGQCPLLAEDIKKAMQRGVEVPTSSYPTTVTINTNKLNPSAANFVPKSRSLDPRCSEFTPSATTLLPTATTPGPIFTKHSIPTSTSSPSSSRLNPTTKEFVPHNLLPSLPTANGGSLENGDFLDEDFGEDFGNYLTVKDILGYEKASPTGADDASGEPVLKGAAEMLLKVYNYPGSFDEIGKKFQNTISNWVPSKDTLTNLAEMLVYWGVSMPDLRYAACKISEMIVELQPGEMEGIGVNFSKALLLRLQSWHIKCYDKKHLTEQEKYAFACYSGFFAEIFAKIRPGNEPVKMMSLFIFKYVEALLGMREDFFIREACNILKLTGSTLVSVDGYDESKMAALVKKINELVLDSNLSRTSVSLLMQVVELTGSKWYSSAAPVQPMKSEAPIKKAGLNTNAVPFVPSDPMLFSETFYDPPILQPPVSCAADWDDFVGDDQSVEGSNNSPDVVEEDDYDGLDPDIELEMEAFIDEIEEHLMLQDFDPELHQDAKPDGRH